MAWNITKTPSLPESIFSKPRTQSTPKIPTKPWILPNPSSIPIYSTDSRIPRTKTHQIRAPQIQSIKGSRRTSETKKQRDRERRSREDEEDDLRNERAYLAHETRRPFVLLLLVRCSRNTWKRSIPSCLYFLGSPAYASKQKKKESLTCVDKCQTFSGLSSVWFHFDPNTEHHQSGA